MPLATHPQDHQGLFPKFYLAFIALLSLSNWVNIGKSLQRSAPPPNLSKHLTFGISSLSFTTFHFVHVLVGLKSTVSIISSPFPFPCFLIAPPFCSCLVVSEPVIFELIFFACPRIFNVLSSWTRCLTELCGETSVPCPKWGCVPGDRIRCSPRALQTGDGSTV